MPQTTTPELPGERTSPRRARSALGAGLAVTAVPLLFVPSLGIVQGGFFPDAWVWSGALLAWIAALGLALRRELRLASRWSGAWLAALALLLAWTAASAAWSSDPTQSLLEARRTIVYLAAAFALAVSGGLDASRRLVVALHLALCVLLGYALVVYLLGPRYLDTFEGYLLARPLGYANAVGILAAIATLLATGAAVHGRSRLARAGAAGSIPVFVFALALTDSRASWFALVLGGCVTVALEARRAELLLVAATAAPCSAVLAWLVSARGLDAASAVHDRREALLAALLAGALLTAAAAALRSGAAGTPRPGRGRHGRAAALAAWVAVAALLVAVAVRLGSSLGPRGEYWHVAWQLEYLAHPYLGSGAGTFGGFWAAYGPVASFGGALDAHSLYLEMLAELGPLGLALTLVALCVPLAPLLERGNCPPYVPQAAGAYVAFLFHSGLDWDWEMPAVTVAALCCAAALLAASRRPSPSPLPPPLRFAALALVVVIGGCAIAAARSGAVPAALARNHRPETTKAPQLREASALRSFSGGAQNALVPPP